MEPIKFCFNLMFPVLFWNPFILLWASLVLLPVFIVLVVCHLCLLFSTNCSHLCSTVRVYSFVFVGSVSPAEVQVVQFLVGLFRYYTVTADTIPMFQP